MAPVTIVALAALAFLMTRLYWGARRLTGAFDGGRAGSTGDVIPPPILATAAPRFCPRCGYPLSKLFWADT